MMKSFMAKTNEVERKWYVIDATDKVLGRLSTEIATILSGKNKPIYTPHVYHTGYPGGDRYISYKQLLADKPEMIIQLAVKGMLPKNSLGRGMIKKMKVYGGPDHVHEAQMPEIYEF